MSFTTFLAQVGKIALGYGAGMLLIIGAVSASAMGRTSMAAVMGLIGIILLLFGVYSERGL